MLYTLGALVVVATVVVAGRRSDSRERRRMWIAALALTGLGLSALVAALLGAWGLFYLAATMLLVGLRLRCRSPCGSTSTCGTAGLT